MILISGILQQFLPQLQQVPVLPVLQQAQLVPVQVPPPVPVQLPAVLQVHQRLQHYDVVYLIYGNHSQSK